MSRGLDLGKKGLICSSRLFASPMMKFLHLFTFLQKKLSPLQNGSLFCCIKVIDENLIRMKEKPVVPKLFSEVNYARWFRGYEILLHFL